MIKREEIDKEMLDSTPEPETVVKEVNQKHPDGNLGVQSPKGLNRDSVSVMQTPIIPIVESMSNKGEKAPIMEQLNGTVQNSPGIADFEEIPVEVCGQLYSTTLELAFALKHKGMPIKSIPEQRVKTQGQILYEILKKNQMSIKHIDLFMLGAGMMGDWKVMCSYVPELKAEAEKAEAEKAAYGELNK